MHAKLSLDEIEVFEGLLALADYSNPEPIRKARRILYLKRAEIRMQERLNQCSA